METVLMVVTLVSLALAIGMSVLAWRLLREDRQRSDARSETLREMAAAPDVDDSSLSRYPRSAGRRHRARPSRAGPCHQSGEPSLPAAHGQDALRQRGRRRAGRASGTHR